MMLDLETESDFEKFNKALMVSLEGESFFSLFALWFSVIFFEVDVLIIGFFGVNFNYNAKSTSNIVWSIINRSIRFDSLQLIVLN